MVYYGILIGNILWLYYGIFIGIDYWIMFWFLAIFLDILRNSWILLLNYWDISDIIIGNPLEISPFVSLKFWDILRLLLEIYSILLVNLGYIWTIIVNDVEIFGSYLDHSCTIQNILGSLLYILRYS